MSEKKGNPRLIGNENNYFKFLMEKKETEKILLGWDNYGKGKKL